jgi:two-component system cell cycle sensor histidine kinase/response regulator CckA
MELRNKTVLVVEDDALVLEVLVDTLLAAGYTVMRAQNPVVALGLAEEHAGPIDLLVTDVVLPGLSGRELGERLAESRAQLRILYISGYAPEVVEDHGVLTQGSGFLCKPFTIDTLITRVDEMLA